MSIFRDPDAPRALPFALEFNRRQFLAGTSALAAATAFGDPALAQTGERIVVADPGGPFGPAFKVAFPDSFRPDTRLTSGQIAREHEPTAQVATMVKTNNYTWDVVTLTLSARDILHPQGLLEPL